jgi:hypothetical protein
MQSSENKCTHKIKKSVRIEPDLYDEDDEVTWEWQELSTLEDIDTGRIKCTMCGQIEYYTGAWRDFWETGKPCPGSHKYDRSKQGI